MDYLMMDRLMINKSSVMGWLRSVATFGFGNSDHDFPMGAMLLDGNISVYGCNFHKTHPKSKAPYSRIHAEFDAIIRGIRELREFKKPVLFVSRFRRDGTFGSAKPCKFCRDLIMKTGIKEVYWSEIKGYGSERFY